MTSEPIKTFLAKPMSDTTVGDQMIMHASGVVVTIIISIMAGKFFHKNQ